MPKAVVLALCIAASIAAPVAFAGGSSLQRASRCSSLNPGGTANTPDPVRAGPGGAATGRVGDRARACCPATSTCVSSTATYNRLYEFALAGGDLFARRRGGEERWRAGAATRPASTAG